MMAAPVVTYIIGTIGCCCIADFANMFNGDNQEVKINAKIVEHAVLLHGPEELLQRNRL